jgi:multicomponent K+:H+ antiporter subunit E
VKAARSLLHTLFPAPLMSLVLWVAWLMVNQSLSAGHLVLGGVLALAVPWWAQRAWPDRPRLHEPLLIAHFVAIVLKDIVMSNIEVARRVLGPEAAIQPRFVWVPLALRDPFAIVTLAGTITMTPGTLSAVLSDDRQFLLVHALHCEDEAALVEQIKERYEAPLKRIFEGRPA